MDAVQVLSRAFLEMRPDDAARVLERFPTDEAREALTDCAAAPAAQVVRRMLPARAAECLQEMPAEQAAAILAELAVEAAAPILRPMESVFREATLELMPPESARALGVILLHQLGTAGALLDPLAFTLPDDVIVGEAMERVRAAGQRVKYYLYVVDRERRLVGVLNLRDFLLADPERRLSSVMASEVVRVRARTPVAAIVADPALRRFPFLPVVDDREVFLGVLELKLLDRRRASDHPALQTLVALGELYWLGMSGLVGGLMSTPEPASGGSNDH